MNETIKAVGGGVSADPVVSAVLGSIGKRYLVEHWESEDGSQEYDLYSDGYIVQKGKFFPSAGVNLINLPKQMRSNDFYTFIQTTRPTFSGEWFPENGYGFVINMQTTSFSVACPTATGDDFLSNWIAQGYAA